MIKLYSIGLGCIFALCTVTWFWYLRTRLASVIDVAWSIGIMLAGAVYLVFGELSQRNIIILGLLMCWSLRLAIFLYWTRIRLKLKDARYEQISAHWSKKTFMFLLHYWFQGLLMSIIALPFYFIGTQTNEHFVITDYIALGLFIFALPLEALADWQMWRHKKQSKQICDKGLWGYSRHPNYFFEWLVWISFALWAWHASYGYFAWISPLALLIIVTAVTGPITEKSSLKSRGDNYRHYQAKTSYFIPWFKKK